MMLASARVSLDLNRQITAKCCVAPYTFLKQQPSFVQTSGARSDHLTFPCFTVLTTTFGCDSQKYHSCSTCPSVGQSFAFMRRGKRSSMMTAAIQTCCVCWSAKVEVGFRGYASG